jgi:DNA-binding CsgD family transcriptional regulator
MANAFQRAKASLTQLDSLQPKAIRQKVLHTLSEFVSSDGSLFFKYALHCGEYVRTTPVAGGDADLVNFCCGIDGRPVRTNLPWDPKLPGPRERNRFVTMQYEPKQMIDSEGWAWREFYGRQHIPVQARALFYDGPRFLGWLGLLRRRDRPFDRDIVQQLDRLVEPVISALVTAESIERSYCTAPADILFNLESRSVDFASESSREWLSSEWMESLEQVIAHAERGGCFPAAVILNGRQFRVVRMLGNCGLRYLLTAEAIDLPVVNPTAALTPRQREVAEYAAAGATNPEIAKALDLSVYTVNDHIRAIYERLSIGSRAELAATLENVEQAP